MSTSQKALKPDFERPRIEEILKAAHRERNEAISQLFGFGFTAVREAVRGLGHKDADHVQGPVAGAKG